MPQALRKLVTITEDPNATASEQIRAAEAILDRGLGKVVESPTKGAQPRAFFQPLTPEQVAFAERMMEALPEAEIDADPNSNGAG